MWTQYVRSLTSAPRFDRLLSCSKIARDWAIDRRRQEKKEAEWCVGPCEDPDEYAPLVPSGEQRDPVDAARQLEVAADLFRAGRMPEHGVDILEGVASRLKYRKVGEDLGISAQSVKGRMYTMRKLFAEQIAARKMV